MRKAFPGGVGTLTKVQRVVTGLSTVSGFHVVWCSCLSSEHHCYFADIVLFTFQWAESGETHPQRDWLTRVLLCYNAVDCIITTCKIFSEITYNMWSGMLNLAIVRATSALYK